eukprot:12891154-Prorocentrum_lima.AAC.1
MLFDLDFGCGCTSSGGSSLSPLGAILNLGSYKPSLSSTTAWKTSFSMCADNCSACRAVRQIPASTMSA